MQSNDTKRFLQSLREDEFRDLVIVPLLEAMDFKQVRVTHGPLEYGKDIVFQEDSDLDGKVFCAAVIKAVRLDGRAESSNSLRSLLNQIEQAIDTPVTLVNGADEWLTKIYVFNNQDIGTHAIHAAKNKAQSLRGFVRLFDLSSILELVERYLPDLLHSQKSKLSGYLDWLFNANFFVKNLRVLGTPRQVALHRCYTGGMLEVAESSLIGQSDGTVPMELLKSEPKILVCGGPGAGKSTLTQWLILQMISDRGLRPRTSAENIPILVELKYIGRDHVKSKKAFANYIKNKAGPLSQEKALGQPATSVTLLFDGVDEIQDAGARASFLRVLDKTLRAKLFGLRISHCIITSRTYTLSSLSGFRTAFVRPFGEREVELFCSRWFSTTTADYEVFFNFLIRRRDLLSIAAVPMLLTMMVILFEEGGENDFPKNRTLIYENMIDLASSRWDGSRGIGRDYREEDLKRLLMILAKELVSESKPSADRTMLHSVIESLEEEGSRMNLEPDPKTVVERYQRASFFILSETNEVEFSHKSVKEFLAARYMFYFNEGPFLERVALQEEWWNVVRFYSGILRRLDKLPAKFLGKLQRKPYLLLECTLEADRTAQSKKDEVFERTIQGWLQGSIRFDDEALPLVHMLSPFLEKNTDIIFSYGGQVQAQFLIAINDMFCWRTTRQARSRLRKVHDILIGLKLNLDQASTVMLSYFSGRNSMTRDLMERFYLQYGELEVSEKVLGSAAKAKSNRKRKFVEKLASDRTIFLKVRNGEDSEDSLVSSILARRLTPLGATKALAIVLSRRELGIRNLTRVGRFTANNMDKEWSTRILQMLIDEVKAAHKTLGLARTDSGKLIPAPQKKKPASGNRVNLPEHKGLPAAKKAPLSEVHSASDFRDAFAREFRRMKIKGGDMEELTIDDWKVLSDEYQAAGRALAALLRAVKRGRDNAGRIRRGKKRLVTAPTSGAGPSSSPGRGSRGSRSAGEK